jgi:hypothetical protein
MHAFPGLPGLPGFPAFSAHLAFSRRRKQPIQRANLTSAPRRLYTRGREILRSQLPILIAIDAFHFAINTYWIHVFPGFNELRFRVFKALMELPLDANATLTRLAA